MISWLCSSWREHWWHETLTIHKKRGALLIVYLPLNTIAQGHFWISVFFPLKNNCYIFGGSSPPILSSITLSGDKDKVVIWMRDHFDANSFVVIDNSLSERVPSPLVQCPPDTHQFFSRRVRGGAKKKSPGGGGRWTPRGLGWGVTQVQARMHKSKGADFSLGKNYNKIRIWDSMECGQNRTSIKNIMRFTTTIFFLCTKLWQRSQIISGRYYTPMQMHCNGAPVASWKITSGVWLVWSMIIMHSDLKLMEH